MGYVQKILYADIPAGRTSKARKASNTSENNGTRSVKSVQHNSPTTTIPTFSHEKTRNTNGKTCNGAERHTPQFPTPPATFRPATRSSCEVSRKLSTSNREIAINVQLPVDYISDAYISDNYDSDETLAEYFRHSIPQHRHSKPLKSCLKTQPSSGTSATKTPTNSPRKTWFRMPSKWCNKTRVSFVAGDAFDIVTKEQVQPKTTMFAKNMVSREERRFVHRVIGHGKYKVLRFLLASPDAWGNTLTSCRGLGDGNWDLFETEMEFGGL